MWDVLKSMLLPFLVIIFAPTLKLMLLDVVAFSGRIALSNYNFWFLLDFIITSATIGLLLERIRSCVCTVFTFESPTSITGSLTVMKGPLKSA